MRVTLFDFELPPQRIALRPVLPREDARMLVVRASGAFEDRQIKDLPGFLQSGDALVVNDTQVLPARLYGQRARRESSAQIEATLIKREGENRWRALARPAKRLAIGDRVTFSAPNDPSRIILAARVAERREGEIIFDFDCAGEALDAAIAQCGVAPLPPYIARRRAEDAADAQDYQTIFARAPGAVAAPTAGLHFTQALLDAIQTRGADLLSVTLHVGAGTFSPVKVEDTDQHLMHSEWACIDAATAERLNAVRTAGGRIIAIGTTALRILETAADEDGTLRAFSGETNIFITPGYRFRCVDALLTNFHLPQSTLFMLVCAFCGLETMQAAYAHAIAQNYRFYSYGDACLLFPEKVSE